MYPIHKRNELSDSFERLDLLWEKYPQFREMSTFTSLDTLLEEHSSYQDGFDELKDEYIVLLRTHSYTNKLLGIEFNDFIRDYTNYPKINDLFKISDVLISDYSACIGDFSILERPIICFAYDYEEYGKSRGLYLDLETAMPSGVKRTEEEVLKQLLTMDYQKESEKTRIMIKERLTYIGGHATEMCAKRLFDK